MREESRSSSPWEPVPAGVTEKASDDAVVETKLRVVPDSSGASPSALVMRRSVPGAGSRETFREKPVDGPGPGRRREEGPFAGSETVFARTVKVFSGAAPSAGRMGRMSRKREPSLSMRMDQSRRFSPVTETISPSPVRESDRVSGFPWTMVKVMSWLEVTRSRFACAATVALVE